MRMLACLLFALICIAPARANERFSLQYQAYAWGVLPLGAAELDVSVRPDAYKAGATVNSGGFLRLFDQTDLRASAAGVIDPAGPIWTDYNLNHNYAKKHRDTIMHADANGVTTEITPYWRYLGDPPVTEAQKSAARDPLSSILAMGMQVARTRACEGVYPTFDGRFLYELRFSGGKQGKYKTDGYDGAVLKCEVIYAPIAGYQRKNAKEMRKKLAHGELWFALTDDPDFAPPVRAVLPLGIGEAHLTLTQWRRVQVSIDEASALAMPAPQDAQPATPPNPPADR